MSRLKRPVSVNENPNPCRKFLEWKSNDKEFEVYDKDSEGENKKTRLKLPFKALFLEHYHTVKGWSDSANSGIWSNEVYYTSEEIEVKNSSGTIVKGLYGENKAQINAAGGDYHRSIYCMLENGEIINLAFKGSVIGGIPKEKSTKGEDVPGWSTFYRGDKKRKIKGNSHLLDNQWLVINEAKDAKSGSVKYSIPFFEVGKALTPKENELADVAAKKLQDYMDVYFNKNVEVEDEIELVLDHGLEKDDLPF